MREEEKHSATQLRNYLESRGLNVAFKEGSDPPDMEFQVDHQKWAVEHTQLFQYVDQGGTPESRMRIDAINLTLEDRLRQSTEGRRLASWVLALHGLADPDVRRDVERSATECILADSLGAFSGIPTKVAELQRIEDPRAQIHVLSLLPPGSKVPNSDRYTADIQATINYAIQEIFRNKAPVLSQLTEYDCRVLLVQSQYMFLNMNNASSAAAEHASLRSGIEKIFLVTVDGVGEVN